MTTEFSKNIGGWVDAMEKAGYVDLAAGFRQDNGTKPEILDRIRQIGLPVQPSRLISLEQFVQDPVGQLADFQFPLYWATLMPQNPNARKFTEVGIDANALIDFATRNAHLAGDFDFHINQYGHNIFGGQIISNEHLVFAEMGQANQTDVVQGRVDPSLMFSAKKRANDVSFQYSTEDTKIRATFWQVLQHLRLKSEDGDRETEVRFLPGYFEFAVTDSPDRPDYGVTFFDYKTGPTFTNLRI